MDLAESYSHVAYAYQCFAQTQPTRLGAWAKLLGIDAPSPEAARVLEIGSGPGMNLFAFAAEHPRAEAVGLDIHAPSVERGNSIATAHGLSNLRFLSHDFSAGPGALGTFDYVIAHGVLSWIDPALRESFFRAARAWLAPTGIFYVNFNARPGFAALGELRTLLLHLTRNETHHRTRIERARAIAGGLSRAIQPKTAQQAALREAASAAFAMSDSRLAHDLLEPAGAPLDLAEFSELAEACDLRSIGATFGSDERQELPREVEAELGGLPVEPVDALALRDFALGKSYREMLLSRRDAPRTEGRPRVEVCAPIRFFSANGASLDAAPGGTTPVHFSGFSTHRAGTDRPAHKLALDGLRRAWPSSVDSQTLIREVGTALGAKLDDSFEQGLYDFLRALNRARLVDLRLTKVPADAFPERPRLLAAIAAELDLGDTIWSLHHIPRTLTPDERRFVLSIDGATSRAELLRAGSPLTEERASDLLEELRGSGFFFACE